MAQRWSTCTPRLPDDDALSTPSRVGRHSSRTGVRSGSFALDNSVSILGELPGFLVLIVVNVAGTFGFGKRPTYLIGWYVPLRRGRYPIFNRIKRS